MTDKAFSDLTSASALNDADIFAITQSGTSKKIASSVVKTYMQEGFTPTSTTTLTNKTVNLTNNTLTGTIAQFNSALSDADFCTIAGSETITNKTLTTPILSATVSGTTSGRLGYLSGALSYGDGTNQQTVATLDRTQTFTAAQSFSGNVTLGDASGDTVTLNSGTVTLNNSTTISAASTKTLTLNGGAGSNGLVIDASNNVGIGGSPAVKLDVRSGSIGTQAFFGYGTGLATVSSNTGVATFAGNTSFSSSYVAYAQYTAASSIDFSSDGSIRLYTDSGLTSGSSFSRTERMRLDSSGNLGLGVTPSAWSGFKALQLNGGSLASSASTNITLLQNAYFNGSAWTYVSSAAASRYDTNGGAHVWYTAGSGTAGNPITFGDPKMTLDASGNLGVGTSSPVSKLHLTGSNVQFRMTNAAGTPTSRHIALVDSDNTWRFTRSGIADDLTIDSSGNVGIGNTSPQFLFEVDRNTTSGSPNKNSAIQVYTRGYGGGSTYYGGIGFAMHEHTNGYWGCGIQAIDDTGSYGAGLAFSTSTGSATPTSTERARIDSSGRFLINKTTITNGTTTDGAMFYPGASGGGSQLYVTNGGTGSALTAATQATTGAVVYFYSGTTSAGYINLTSASTCALVGTSDQRLKTNVTPAGSALQSLLDFPVDQFDWIKTGDHQDFGAIAQKVYAVIPDMVAVPEDPDEMWGIAWSNAVPRLIKAIQELSSQVYDLKAELNELKQRIK